MTWSTFIIIRESEGHSALLSPTSLVICDELSAKFKDVSMDDVSASNANVTFFVVGYIGRSIVRRGRCSAFKKLLILNDDDVAPLTFVGNSNVLLELSDSGRFVHFVRILFRLDIFCCKKL